MPEHLEIEKSTKRIKINCHPSMEITVINILKENHILHTVLWQAYFIH